MTILRLSVFLAPLFLVSSARDQEDVFKKYLSGYATDQTQKILAKKSFTVDQPTFVGKISPVDLQKTLKVTIQKVTMNNDQLSVTATLKASYEFNGALKGNGVPQQVTIGLSVDLGVEGTAKLSSRQDKFFLKPELKKLEIKSLQIDSLAPKCITVEKGNVEQALKDELKKNQAAVLEYLNGALPEQQLK
jgi:hypothetical protein